MTDRWTIHHYGSGTHVVVREGVRAPHFYVHAAPGLTRMETCEQLRDWLNGDAARPEWADDLMRASERIAHHPGVTEHGGLLSISAVGPSVESEPGRGDWTPDPEFEDDRARLMDLLCGVGVS